MILEVDASQYSVILDSTRAQIEFIKWALIGVGPVILAGFAWLAKQGNEARQQLSIANQRAIEELKAAAEARRLDREKESETRLQMHDDNREDMQKLTEAVQELVRAGRK